MNGPVDGSTDVENAGEAEFDADDDDFDSTFWHITQWSLVAAILVVFGGAFLVISVVLRAL